MLLDGGFATELERRGYRLDPVLWSARALLDAPERVRAVHAAYLEAGADVITSASYQASVEGFARIGVGRADAERLLVRSVELACEARDAHARATGRRAQVAASIGPYGATLADGAEYRGDYGLDAAALARFHRERLQLLAGAGADLLAIETVPCLLEAEVLLELLAGLRGAPPAWLSFSARDGAHLGSGEAFAQAMGLARQSRELLAAGVNCTAPEHVLPLLRAAGPGALPFVVYPNRGESWDVASRSWIPGPAVDLAALAPAWRSAGASLIGGCCRTTPEDIAAIRKVLLPPPRSEGGGGTPVEPRY